MIDNNIRDFGINAFAEALEVNTSLTWLSLEAQKKAFGGTIDRTNRNDILSKIYDLVSRNKINYEISKNPSLTEIDFKITY